MSLLHSNYTSSSSTFSFFSKSNSCFSPSIDLLQGWTRSPIHSLCMMSMNEVIGAPMALVAGALGGSQIYSPRAGSSSSTPREDSSLHGSPLQFPKSCVPSSLSCDQVRSNLILASKKGASPQLGLYEFSKKECVAGAGNVVLKRSYDGFNSQTVLSRAVLATIPVLEVKEQAIVGTLP